MEQDLAPSAIPVIALGAAPGAVAMINAATSSSPT